MIASKIRNIYKKLKIPSLFRPLYKFSISHNKNLNLKDALKPQPSPLTQSSSPQSATTSSLSTSLSTISKHAKQLSTTSIQDFFTKLGIDHRNAPNGYRVRQCMFCTKPHYNQVTNLYTLIVNKKTGVFYCHRCASKGNWNQFKLKYINLGEAVDVGTMLSDQIKEQLNTPGQLPLSQIQYFYYLNNLKKQQYQDIQNYLKQQCRIKQQTLQKYSVGAGVQTFHVEGGKAVEARCVFYPIFQLIAKKSKNKVNEKNKQENNQYEMYQTKIVKYKARGLPPANQRLSRLYPIGAKSGFFGLNTIDKTDKVLVLTDGQINAMAINQQTGIPAISLPQGANSLSDQCLNYLNQFQKIVLWFENDESGRIGEDKISFKIGQQRTYIVRHDHPQLKNALDFLRLAPQQMKNVIQKSRTKPGQNIISFQDIQQQVKNRIFHQEEYVGIKVDWMPYFNKKVKGIRMQEVTIVSGPTGCGKTTFLSQLSLDLCRKQIPVLWGSFEIKNQVLVTNMIIQYAKVNLFQKKQLFQTYSDQFKNLPLYWLSFHGSNDVQRVLAAIQYSIQKNNISLVILDTLQFLLSEQAQGYNKFDLQDKVLTRLRKMATSHNVHIVIVIHPRKTEDTQDIQIHSIYGTSKATQQADNVWMIQKRQNTRLFDIKKNRFDGDIGKVAMGFDKNLKSFFQLNRKQISQLINNQTNLQKIIKKRNEKQERRKQQNQHQKIQQEQELPEEYVQNSRKKKIKKSQ